MYPYHRACKVCGASFKVWDARRRYCSNACRQKAYRRRKQEADFACYALLQQTVTSTDG